MVNHKNLIVSVIIIVIFSVIIFNFYNNYGEKVNNLNKEIQEWSKKEHFAEEKIILDKKYLNLIEELFDDFFDFKKLIEQTAFKHEMDIDSLKRLSRGKGGFFSDREVKLTLAGSYSELINFLDELESYRFVGIKVLNIKSAEKTTDLLINVILLGLTKK